MEPTDLMRYESGEFFRSNPVHEQLPRADFDSIVKERDEAVKFWTALADAANEIDAVLIEDGTEGRAESSVDAVRTIIKERDAAHSRADKAERERDEARALLQEALDWVVADQCTQSAESLRARIDALLRGSAS